jgi:hypothetical protein
MAIGTLAKTEKLIMDGSEFEIKAIPSSSIICFREVRLNANLHALLVNMDIEKIRFLSCRLEENVRVV